MYSKTEIAIWYGISPRTLTDRLNHAGIIQKEGGKFPKRRLTPKQLIQIFNEFGIPEKGNLPKGMTIPKLNKKGELVTPEKKKKAA